MDAPRLEGHAFLGAESSSAVGTGPTGAGFGEAGGFPPTSAPRPLIGSLDWRQSVGGALIVVALVVIAITWFQISGTLEPGKQMPYVISGGLTAAVLCAAGVTFLVAYEHVCDRAAIEELYQRVDTLEDSVQAIARVANRASRSPYDSVREGGSPRGSRTP